MTQGETVDLEVRGRTTFRVSCANCHGEEGKGDGPIAPFMKVSVPDLTTIAARGGGEFPRDRVLRILDGRDEVPIHGPREMPIWGEVFQDPRVAGTDRGLPEAQEDRARRRMEEVLAYLESIQEPQ
jgi:mono/diheme cytochrome c family protein